MQGPNEIQHIFFKTEFNEQSRFWTDTFTFYERAEAKTNKSPFIGFYCAFLFELLIVMHGNKNLLIYFTVRI